MRGELHINPCLLYVGTRNGMYVFYFDGKDLNLVRRGVEGNSVRGIAVHPENPEVAYVTPSPHPKRPSLMLGLPERFVGSPLGRAHIILSASPS